MKQETGKAKLHAVPCELKIEKNSKSGYNAGQFFENEIALQWLSTVEAASFLRVSENALRIMVHREQIVAYKFGRRLRFKPSDCQQLILMKGAA